MIWLWYGLVKKKAKKRRMIKMCNTTKNKIAKYNALTKLLKWYGTNDFEKIPESAAIKFLAKLESGEIKV